MSSNWEAHIANTHLLCIHSPISKFNYKIEKRNPHPKSHTTALQKPRAQFIFYFLYIHIMAFVILLF
jgi:hypothetical protein